MHPTCTSEHKVDDILMHTFSLLLELILAEGSKPNKCCLVYISALLSVSTLKGSFLAWSAREGKRLGVTRRYICISS